MIQIDVSDTIFLFCLLVGGGLLLISVVLGELLGGIGDAVGLDHDIGGSGVVPPILAFVSLFGAGGLFASQVLDLDGTASAIVGILAGTIGAVSVGAAVPRPAAVGGRPRVRARERHRIHRQGQGRRRTHERRRGRGRRDGRPAQLLGDLRVELWAGDSSSGSRPSRAPNSSSNR